MGEEKRLVAGSVAFCAMLGLEATSEEREALESQLHFCAGGFAGQQKRLVVAPVASRIISAGGADCVKRVRGASD